ncbi:diguanylate cyclase domain-containing protein [Pokkaliibacter sp. CJK22405]|uniref:diguanylate cyclase domain-containing protein n=1 Tax=Pokkaliibacter sp. CJK22405 TaxID=3384615 RepID=UPI003984B6F7
MLNTLHDTLQRSGHRPRILIVDDQPINIRALNEVFKEDCDILMATKGEQALEQARSQQPDIILLDIVMPGMDGHEVCRQLKADPSTENIPVIFVTSQNDDNDEAFGFEIGAVDFISKPINPVIVRARVRTQLALKLQYDFARNMALLDGLTGIANRRRFDEDLIADWRLCLREERPMTMLLIDVDYFKRYNDHYGHQAGDECLRMVAKGLQGILRRPSDLLSRYGGEEFACLLPFTDLVGGEGRAEAMLKAVQDLKIPHALSDASDYVSISIGVACVIPCNDQQPKSLIKQADEALYQSKAEGRARFSSYAGIDQSHPSHPTGSVEASQEKAH